MADAPIVLVPHDPAWGAAFAAMRAAIIAACDPWVTDVVHIGDPRTHQAHMFVAGHPEVARHVRFRDYLRTHAGVAQRYEALKQALAAQFADDIGAYADAKDPFCAEIDDLARAAG